jgi:uncharacterized protein (TIGR03382 family)
MIFLLLLGAASASLPVTATNSTCSSVQRHLAVLDQGTRCGTIALATAWQAAEAAGQTSCLAKELAARGIPHWNPHAFGSRKMAPPPLPGSKAVRDTYHSPQSQESENFVLFWGNGSTVTTSDVENLLAAFETGWSYYQDTMGLPAPFGSDLYKFDVYIGDTGSGLPSSYGNGGYSTSDSEGFPIIVIARDSLYDPQWADSTAVHEFFHAAQAATGAFTDYYDGSASAWYTEATATWAEGEVYPEIPYYSYFLFGFAFVPYVALNWFDYPDSGSLLEYHQYGAFIFPRYLSEIAADWSIVSDSWLQGGAHEDPLDVLDDLLAERGSDIRTAWVDFTAHNATWDYADRATYQDVLASYSSYFDDESVSETYSGTGPDTLTEATWSLPQRYGSNTIALMSPHDGVLDVNIAGDATGNQGSPATWSATMVLVNGDGPTYVPVPFDGSTGALRVPDAGTWFSAWLVIDAWSPTWKSGEHFGYRFLMDVHPDESGQDTQDGDGPANDTADDGSGISGASACGCTSGGSPPVAWLLLGGLLALAERRKALTRSSTRCGSVRGDI